MKPILSIRNPDRWWGVLEKTIDDIAKAKKNHKPRLELEHEATLIRAAIIAYENRRAA